MKQKIIQLVLILRYKMGTLLSDVKGSLDEGRAPESDAAATLNSCYGKMHALLWLLREMAPEDFPTLLETIGAHIEDDDVKQIAELDKLLETYGEHAGKIAIGAVKSREEEQ